MGIESNKKTLTKDDIVADLRKLGVMEGDLLNLKVSIKSIGWIEGGVKALIEALLEVIGPKGTIVSDAFIMSYPLPLTRKNAALIADDKTPSYCGLLANGMINYPNSVRSKHPIMKYVAIGHLADDLMNKHTEDSGAYEPLYRMSQMGGKNLKIGKDELVEGVGTTHVAVGLLGYKKKLDKSGVNFRDVNGEVKLFKVNWSGGCGRGFNKFIPIYRELGAILHEGKIGNAESKITDMKHTLEIELEKLAKEPEFFLCDDPWCLTCRTDWPFSERTVRNFFLRNLKPVVFYLSRNESFKGLIKKVLKILKKNS